MNYTMTMLVVQCDECERDDRFDSEDSARQAGWQVDVATGELGGTPAHLAMCGDFCPDHNLAEHAPGA